MMAQTDGVWSGRTRQDAGDHAAFGPANSGVVNKLPKVRLVARSQVVRD
jgi:hypothetical protein